MMKQIKLTDNLNTLDIIGTHINIIEAKGHGASQLGLLNHRILPQNEGVLFRKKKLFHTFGMRFPICVLAFDNRKKLVTHPTLVKPNRVFLCPSKSNYVVEISHDHENIKREFSTKNRIYVFNHIKSKIIYSFFKLLPILIIGLTLLMTISNVFALSAMDLNLGKTRTINLEQPPQSIQIEDPEIVEIERIGVSNSIKLIPKQPGKTFLTFKYFDGDDETININVSTIPGEISNIIQKTQDAESTHKYIIDSKIAQLKKISVHYSFNAGKFFLFGKIETIQTFKKLSKIVASQPTLFFPGFDIAPEIINQVIDSMNTDLRIMGFQSIKIIQSGEKLLLKGVHTSDPNKEKTWAYVSALIPNIIDATTAFFGESKLVQINIEFFEVGKLHKKETGVQYPALGKGGFGININSEKPIFQITPFSVLFHALEGRNYVREIAKPVIMTRSGEKATFLAGGEVPIQTVTSSSSSTNVSVTFKSIGIIFDVVPRVHDDGTIWIKLNVEYSQINEKLSYQNTPGFNSRKINTNIILNEGSAAIISGLIQNSDIKQMDGIPFLKSLPILGSLFASNAHKNDSTELWIALSAMQKSVDDLTHDSSKLSHKNQHLLESLYESIL